MHFIHPFILKPSRLVASYSRVRLNFEVYKNECIPQCIGAVKRKSSLWSDVSKEVDKLATKIFVTAQSYIRHGLTLRIWPPSG